MSLLPSLDAKRIFDSFMHDGSLSTGLAPEKSTQWHASIGRWSNVDMKVGTVGSMLRERDSSIVCVV